MQEYYQFVLFFTFLFSIFGLMQWYILHNYFRWLQVITSEQSYPRFRMAGIIFFAVANFVFLLRFPSTDMGWYQQPLFQNLIIYPGGIFYGAVVFTFIILLIVRTSYRLVTLIDKISTRAPFSHIRSGFRLVFTRPAKPENFTDSGDLFESQLAPDPESTSDSSQTEQPELKKAAKWMDEQPETPISSQISRRQFLRTAGTAVIATPVLFTIGASTATSHDYRIVHRKLHYPGLPTSLNGLKIVQISDIHSGIYMTETQMQDIFELANEQHPDLVTITGDFVDNSISEIPALCRSITRLKSEYGIYGCLGNHDHYASASAVTSALRQRSIQLLTNDHQTLTINGERLTLIGVDDAGAGNRNFARLDQALYNMANDSFQILLSHRPDMFDQARKHGIDLTLAGHTHGGQIGFDFMGIPVYPIHLFQKYAKGLYEHGDHKLYVNVGIGMVGVPVRLVRPELTVIELTNSISVV